MEWVMQVTVTDRAAQGLGAKGRRHGGEGQGGAGGGPHGLRHSRSGHGCARHLLGWRGVVVVAVPAIWHARRCRPSRACASTEYPSQAIAVVTSAFAGSIHQCGLANM